MSFTSINQNTIEYKGHRYQLDLSFRMVLLYFQAIRDEGLTVAERLEISLKALVMSDVSSLDIQAQSELLERIFNTKLNNDRDRIRAKVLKSGKRSFDFVEDESLIKAGFQQQYGIDLDETTLSWERFTTMLDGLDENTQFQKIVHIRQAKISDDMEPEQQEYLKKMKLIYGLKQAKPNNDGKLTHDELEIELANLDLPHKLLRKQELKKQGKI
ncbi:Gp15 family bacteriophage protein [Lactiplantibacillus plantarum]|uniref:Gp15 family bacteriophage protein n=1 Tax=Lactiplantibacillus plantarum TaxID=1590 RepID=UPI0009763BC3|nr:Gp15 family bacteriophage protein [Lactiplantibacillus plantarum]